jgi:hypothetical protein
MPNPGKTLRHISIHGGSTSHQKLHRLKIGIANYYRCRSIAIVVAPAAKEKEAIPRQ